ncbi:MAG: UDP-glucose 4-epimerase [Phycisphaerae bacterium]|nr:UDP-glucose 4-epimerase [Phycisphaerae bacterium]
MAARRIAIFGASGMIGSEVARALVADGHEVTALRHSRPVPEGCRIVEGSVSDFDAVQRTLGDSDIVCQLATTKNDRDTFIDVAVRGTFHILDAIVKRGGCEQLILAGADASVGIWYYRHMGPLTEDAPLRAYPGYYPLSKVLEETLVTQYDFQHGIPYTILRMGFVRYPMDVLKFFLAGQVKGRTWKNMFRGAMSPELQKRADGEGQGFALVGIDQSSGLPIRRTFVSYRDVVQAWRLALGNPLATRQVFNCVHPSCDMAAVGRLLSERLGVPAERVPLDAHSYDMDTTKLRTVLGWRPQDDTFSMLESAIAELGG